MAGIGFVLRKLTRRDDLLGILQGFAHSSLVATGPWVFTVLSLAGVYLIGSHLVGPTELNSFRLIIIYNFAFSLVFSGSLVMLITRCLADRIFAMDVRQAPGMLLGGMTLLFFAQLPLVFYFYFFYFNLTPAARIAAVINFFLISGIWLVGVFLTALKNYRAVSWTFAIGMFTAMVGSVVMTTSGTAGMLFGFDLGLAVIFFSLISQVLAEYPYPVERPFAFLAYAGRYRDIALGGMVYNLAIWIDKWVLWASPYAETLPTGMVSYPVYDGAMFLAYLSILPSIALFVFSVETSFFEKYLRFYRDIQRHANLDRIRRNHLEILDNLSLNGRNFVVLQGTICVVLVLLAPLIFEWLGIAYIQLGIFRLGLLGALFHSLFLFMSIVLSYFDLRRANLYLQILFLVSNGSFTYLTSKAGFSYLGLGYCLACIVTCVAAYLTLVHYIHELPYQTFVRGNEAVRRK